MRLYGLIGYPLSHSFSENFFRKKFETEKISDCEYRLFLLNEIAELPELLRLNPQLCGLNVTIPYKKQILSFLNENKIPGGLNACNCIKISDGQLTGYNTDWTAFRQTISPMLEPHHTEALILGDGGAAEAVNFALKEMGIGVAIVSRTIRGGSIYTYDQLNKKIMYHHKIIINTTPLGLFPDTGSCPPIPFEFITPDHLLFDVIYNPAKTIFLQKGEERGAKIKNGEEMLVLQAEESWKIWNEKL